jgi:hypothetical protein
LQHILRTKWHTIHNDEVHFRDTANGFLVWAVSVVITVAFLAAAAASMAGGVAESSTGGSDASQGSALVGDAYFVDRLFRSDHLTTENDSSVRAEGGRTFAHALLNSDVATATSDSTYLARLVTAKTGLAPNDAEKRVSDTIADAMQTANIARKATAHLLLWIFLALLIGAFCASYAATIGGRQRDNVKLI